jgi:hypothetical protein
MCPGNDNQVDWTAAATPTGESVARSPLPRMAKPVQHTRASVMNALLGDNDLSATDVSGSDPYNATGRQFRR